MKYLLLAGCFFTMAFSCSKEEAPVLENYRLKSYRIVYETVKEREVYRGVYDYDKKGNLITEIQHDTTYSKNSGLITPVFTTFTNSFNEDGFLVKRVRSAISIQLTNIVTTTYDYREGRLSLENLGNSVVEYRYNSDGSLKTRITTSLTSGNKVVDDYLDEIPASYIKTDNGFLFETGNQKQYYDRDLLRTRLEIYNEHNLRVEQDYDQQKNGVPQAFLPDYRGFPKIKSHAYRRGVERSIVTYQIINGVPVLTDEKRLNPEFDSAGRLVKSTGTERINQETTNPESRELTFEYTYEKY